MPITKLTPDYPFTADRLAELKQVVPEAFVDGKINWDVLRETLGDHLEEPSEEHFGLFWPGKSEARRLASIPSKGTLKPCPGEGVNEESTHNVFIEGQNLDVLKILLKSYAGKIKMIYIDPPYNTGNDFIYNDNFTEPLEAYLREEGVINFDGDLLSTNTRSDGRFHSKWLNVLFPRLLLSRQFLSEDGVIFISIDDNEVHNLRQIMNEIFGEVNFICQFVWEKKYTTSNNISGVSSVHEYILCYSRNIEFLDSAINRLPYTDEARARYSNPDSDPRGDWMDVSYHGPKSPTERPNLNYPIKHPKTGKEIWPIEKSWAYEKSVHEMHVKENRLWWGKDHTYSEPRLKKFVNEMTGGLIPKSLLTYEDVGGTSTGRNDLRKIFGEGEAVFDNPKPISLVKKLLQIGSKKDSLILDFFAGSGSTGHSVFELNLEENGNRNFILVQIPEESGKRKFSTISEICKARLKNVIYGILEEKKSVTPMLDFGNIPEQDLGFTVYSLGKSNIEKWINDEEIDIQNTRSLFEEFSNPLIPNWKHENLLAEILLIEGFPLTSEIMSPANIDFNKTFHITAPGFCDHDLFICLDVIIDPETLNLLPLENQDIFVCLDSALSDELKVRLEDKFNIHVI